MLNSSRKIARNLTWFPAYCWQRLVRGSVGMRAGHLIFCVADHFEPSFVPGEPPAPVELQRQRVEQWCLNYPRLFADWRDTDGCPWVHTYFYPAEQHDDSVVGPLFQHCREGWGEIEVQLHHGVETPDTPANTRRILVEFRTALEKLGCLSRWEGSGAARYAFVHGNWALANSLNGTCCGVDEEMHILAETGCYADFTLPAAPNRAHVGELNSLYECALPLEERAPQRKGVHLRAGRPVDKFPLIVQGPLMLNFDRWPVPHVDNGSLTGENPPTLRRLELWRRASIMVQGRPDWLFIKLNCHSMDPRDEAANTGEPVRRFLKELAELVRNQPSLRVHFTTVRQMVNVILAALDGKEGNPGDYRDYRLQLISPSRRA